MRKRLIGLIAVTAILVGGTALADDGRAENHPVQVIGRALELSAEQMEAFHALLQTRHDANGALHEQVELLQKELADLVKGENPDPAAIGDVVLETRDLRAEIGQNQQAFLDGFHALLSPEQQIRLRHINQVALAERAAEAMHQVKVH